MDVLWCVNIVLPELARRIGLPIQNQGGWMPSLVEAVRRNLPQVKLTVLCVGPKEIAVSIRETRYVMLRQQRWFFSGARASGSFLKKLHETVRACNPNIIHIHGTEGFWASLPINVWQGHPTIASLQGIITGCYPHYVGGLTPCELFDLRNLPNFLLSRYSVFRASRVWRTRMAVDEIRAFQEFDALLGRTNWDRAWTSYLAPAKPYYQVGEILRSVFYRGGRTESTVVPHQIYCGAALSYPLKGGHWLLRAVARLKRDYPDVRLRVANAEIIHAIGWRGQLRRNEYRRYVLRLAKKLGVLGSVDFLPPLTAEQVAEELKTASVFVLPSLCENSPNSLGEAMLMECPCVATDVGGTATVLDAGRNGVMVPSADPAMLYSSIKAVFDCDEAVKTRVKNARRFAEVYYSERRVTQELISAYEEVLHV